MDSNTWPRRLTQLRGAGYELTVLEHEDGACVLSFWAGVGVEPIPELQSEQLSRDVAMAAYESMSVWLAARRRA